MGIVSERLKYLRISNEYTQDYIAMKMHIGRSTYTHWETGKYTPDLDKIIWLCDFYSVSADYILGRTDIVTNEANNTPKPSLSNEEENDKITNYYNRLNEENQDYIRGEMVKLYREQENDTVENNTQKKIG